MLFPLGFVVIVLCALLGCAVGPNHQTPPIPVLNSQFDGDAGPVAQSDFRIQRWWELFHDPVLDQLLAQGIAQNLDLRQSYHRILEARANLGLVAGGKLPDFDALAEYRFTKRSSNARPFVAQNAEPFDFYLAGFDSAWEIDLFGRIARSIEKANAELEVQDADFEFIKMTLLADIASSYFQVRVLQEQIGLTQLSIEIQNNTKELVEERSEAGLSTELDVAQTLAFRDRTESTIPVLEQQLTLELNRLALLIGQAPNQSLREFLGQRGLPHVPFLNGVGIPVDLLRARPDVRREERAVAAASASIGIAEADLYPQLSLLGTISLSSQGLSNIFDSGSLAFEVGPSFRWNILHFGRINQNIEIQQQKMNQTVDRYQQTVLSAVREVEDALVSQSSAYFQATKLDDAIKQDEKAVELSLQRYKVGKANFQRVIDAQRQMLQDQQVQLTAKAQAVIESVRLFKALGGGCGFPSQTIEGSYQTYSLNPQNVVHYGPAQNNVWDGHNGATTTNPWAQDSSSPPIPTNAKKSAANEPEKKSDDYPLEKFKNEPKASESDDREIPVPKLW
jgi:NodT family efflux transporter outer membrane factor (OMF) lipoprotein